MPFAQMQLPAAKRLLHSSLCSSQRIISFQQFLAGIGGTFQIFAAVGLDHAGIGEGGQLRVDGTLDRKSVGRDRV